MIINHTITRNNDIRIRMLGYKVLRYNNKLIWYLYRICHLKKENINDY